MASNVNTQSHPKPIDIVTAQSDFQASNANQLSFKKGQTLLLISGPSYGWATVRELVHPLSSGVGASAYVPQSTLKFEFPTTRAFAKQLLPGESAHCIPLFPGRNMRVYIRHQQWLLVKTDAKAEIDLPSAVGWVRLNAVKFFDGDQDPRGPSTSKQLPKHYCALCEESVTDTAHFQCSRCRLDNGDPFSYCIPCTQNYQACFVHQVIKGHDHLFNIWTAPGFPYTCSHCKKGIVDSPFYSCITCRYTNDDDFDLCADCHYDPKIPGHAHSMIFISQDGCMTQPHTAFLRDLVTEEDRYACNGCCRDVIGYALRCKVCTGGGYDLCFECAEVDRGGYLHSRWSEGTGAPHTFEIVRSLWGLK